MLLAKELTERLERQWAVQVAEDEERQRYAKENRRMLMEMRRLTMLATKDFQKEGAKKRRNKKRSEAQSHKMVMETEAENEI